MPKISNFFYKIHFFSQFEANLYMKKVKNLLNKLKVYCFSLKILKHTDHNTYAMSRAPLRAVSNRG